MFGIVKIGQQSKFNAINKETDKILSVLDLLIKNFQVNNKEYDSIIGFFNDICSPLCPR